MADRAGRPTIGGGATLSTVAQIGTAAALGALGIIIARLLGPADTGAFSLVLASLNLLIPLSSLGIGLGITYEVARRRWPAPEAFHQSVVAAFTLGTFGALVGAGLMLLAHDGPLQGVPLATALATLAAVPFGLGFTYGWSLALASEHYRAYAVAYGGQAVVLLALVATLTPPLGLDGAIASLGGSYVLVALGLFAWGRRRFGAGPAGSLASAGERLRAAARFGLRAYLANTVYLFALRADLFVLNTYAPASTVGRYAIALSITELALLLPRSLSAVILPRVADLASLGEGGDQPVIAKSVRHVVLLAILGVPAVAGILALVPLVWGSDFTQTIQFGLLLLPGTTGLGISNVLAANTAAKGKPEYGLYAALTVTPPTIVLYLLLIPQLEAVGAALASVASYWALTALTLAFFRRATGVRELRSLLPGRDELRDYRLLAGRLRRASSS